MDTSSTRVSRLLPVLGPALGFGIAVCATGRSARADVIRLGADGTAGFATGRISDVGQPSVGGDLNARLLLGPRLSLGVMAGLQRQTLFSNNELAWNPRVRLSETTLGATGRWALGPAAWTARPFLGLDVGYARLSTSNADFDPYPLSRQTTGFFTTPQIGLEATLVHGLAFDVAWRYQYLRAREALGVGDLETRDLSGAGMAAGLSLAL